jgi:hypothetical protein
VKERDWQKSTRSPQGNSCVEAKITWRKASYSGHGDEHGGGNCVEVAPVETSAR